MWLYLTEVTCVYSHEHCRPNRPSTTGLDNIIGFCVRAKQLVLNTTIMGYQPLKYTLYYICRLICTSPISQSRSSTRRDVDSTTTTIAHCLMLLTATLQYFMPVLLYVLDSRVSWDDDSTTTSKLPCSVSLIATLQYFMHVISDVLDNIIVIFHEIHL